MKFLNKIIMDSAFKKTEDLVKHIREYIDVRLNSAKLSVAEKTSLVVSNIIAGILVLSVFLFVIVFAGIALAYALAEWTGRLYAGFLIVAGLYFLLAVIIWISKDRLLRMPVFNSILNELISDDNNEDEV